MQYIIHTFTLCTTAENSQLSTAACLLLSNSGQLYYLACPQTSSVINIRNIQRVWMTSYNAAICLPLHASSYCISTPYQTSSIYSSCSGKSSCNVAVPVALLEPEFTSNCPQAVNYLQIVYDCLVGKTGWTAAVAK